MLAQIVGQIGGVAMTETEQRTTALHRRIEDAVMGMLIDEQSVEAALDGAEQNAVARVTAGKTERGFAAEELGGAAFDGEGRGGVAETGPARGAVNAVTLGGFAGGTDYLGMACSPR